MIHFLWDLLACTYMISLTSLTTWTKFEKQWFLIFIYFTEIM